MQYGLPVSRLDSSAFFITCLPLARVKQQSPLVWMNGFPHTGHCEASPQALE